MKKWRSKDGKRMVNLDAMLAYSFQEPYRAAGDSFLTPSHLYIYIPGGVFTLESQEADEVFQIIKSDKQLL